MLKWLSGILTTVLSGWILHDRLLHRLRSWYFTSSVVTQLRCDEIISQGFVANLLVNLSVKEVWKSVNIWRSYGQYCSALFFSDSQCSSCLVVLLVVIKWIVLKMMYYCICRLLWEGFSAYWVWRMSWTNTSRCYIRIVQLVMNGYTSDSSNITLLFLDRSLSVHWVLGFSFWATFPTF